MECNYISSAIKANRLTAQAVKSSSKKYITIVQEIGIQWHINREKWNHYCITLSSWNNCSFCLYVFDFVSPYLKAHNILMIQIHIYIAYRNIGMPERWKVDKTELHLKLAFAFSFLIIIINLEFNVVNT